jgi:hypothetical protein
VPNRRRRRLSTALSAVAALAVTSPVAIVAVNELTAATKPAPQHREFFQANLITDLPNELMSALSQGLSQFGVNVPPLPSLLTGSGSTTPPVLTAPGLAPSLATPGVGLPSSPAPIPDAVLYNPALANPALTSPIGAPSGPTTPPLTGLTTPPVTDPALTPISTDPALTPISTDPALPALGEVPISAPLGPDPALGTYPILGDPSLAAMPAATDSGGLIGELSSAANQLGAGQAIDLLKGVVMPAITSAIKSATPPAVPAAPPAPVPPAEPGA